MKRVLRWSLILALSAGFVLLVAGLIFFVWGPGGVMLDVMRHQNAGPFDRKKMEAVVEQVRLKHLAPDEEREYRLDPLGKPGLARDSAEEFRSKVRFDPSQDGHVFARISKQGKLTVLIVTNDMNHAGTYGFVYSEEPVKQGLSEFDGWQAEGQIDEHWWKVGNHEN